MCRPNKCEKKYKCYRYMAYPDHDQSMSAFDKMNEGLTSLFAKHDSVKLSDTIDIGDPKKSILWTVLIAILIFAGLVAYMITNGFNVNFK